MSRDPQTPPGGSRQAEPPRNLDEALDALQAEREQRERAETEIGWNDDFFASINRELGEHRNAAPFIDDAVRILVARSEQAERRLDVAVKALKMVRAYHSVPEGAAPCRFAEMLAVVDDAIEAQSERGAEGEAPSTERS